MNRFSLNTRDRVKNDVGINESVGVELVGNDSFNDHQTCTHFNVRGVRAVVDGEAGLVFGFVVHGFESFLLNGDVVDVPNGYKDTPDSLVVG